MARRELLAEKCKEKGEGIHFLLLRRSGIAARATMSAGPQIPPPPLVVVVVELGVVTVGPVSVVVVELVVLVVVVVVVVVVC